MPETPSFAAGFSSSFILVFVLSISLLLLRERSGDASSGPARGLRTLVVLGSGGHTTEMLSMLAAMPKAILAGSVFVIAATDAMSQAKLEQCFPGAKVRRTPRAREVKQSWATSLLTTFVAAIHALKTVFQERPDLVLCNGPGTCVPIAYAAWLMRTMRVQPCAIVFTESVARVTSLSLSGKLLYLIADKFMVQWPALLAAYPRAKCVGFVI